MNKTNQSMIAFALGVVLQQSGVEGVTLRSSSKAES
jgi:hypothetical protein